MSRLLKILFFLVILANTVKAERIGVFYDHSIPQFEFAASDIKVALENNGFEADLKPIVELSAKYENKKIVIALKSNASVMKRLIKEGGDNNKIGDLGEQAFALRTTQLKQQAYWVIGGDIAGALYGGLQIAENIAFHSLEGTYNEEQEPYIKKRGI